MTRKVSIFVSLFALFMVFPGPCLGADASFDGDDINSVEERRILVSLKKERSRLEEKEKFLTAREMELKTLEIEVDKKLDELERLRATLTDLLAQKDEEEVKRIQNLGKMYQKMDPIKAAQLLTTLDEELAVDILSSMKSKSAGRILNNVDKSKAARLSTVFSISEIN